MNYKMQTNVLANELNFSYMQRKMCLIMKSISLSFAGNMIECGWFMNDGLFVCVNKIF